MTEEVYCIFELGEGGNRNLVFNESELYFDDKQSCLKKFFDLMVSIFAQYEECYHPQSIDDIKIIEVTSEDYGIIRKDRELHVCDLRGAAKYTCDKKEKRNIGYLIYYETNGGLRLGFATLMIKSSYIMNLF